MMTASGWLQLPLIVSPVTPMPYPARVPVRHQEFSPFVAEQWAEVYVRTVLGR